MTTIIQHRKNLWDVVKAVLKGKYAAIQAYVRKEEKSHKHMEASQHASKLPVDQ